MFHPIHTHCSRIMMMTILALCLGATSVFGQPSSGMQTSPKAYHDMPVEDVTTLMGKKLARGIVNVVTGVGELPRQLALTTQSEGALIGIPLGLFKGVMMTVVRTAAGAVEIALFLAPAPGFYEPILSPGLVWEDVDGSNTSTHAQSTDRASTAP